MKNSFARLAHLSLMLALLAPLAGCNPKYNWRDVHAKDTSFTILMPDKPVSVTRKVNLDTQQVDMTMTAAQVDGVSFAVGVAELSDEKSAVAALTAMKQAMLHNINGTITTESAASNANATDLEATGTPAGGSSLLLLAHFEARGKRVYQAIVLGKADAVPREEAKTFLASFKAN